MEDKGSRSKLITFVPAFDGVLESHQQVVQKLSALYEGLKSG
jgi:hypothetical protein